MTLRATEPLAFSRSSLEQHLQALDPPSPSALIALARALDAALLSASPDAAERVSLESCGLERVQIGPVLASRTVRACEEGASEGVYALRNAPRATCLACAHPAYDACAARGAHPARRETPLPHIRRWSLTH